MGTTILKLVMPKAMSTQPTVQSSSQALVPAWPYAQRNCDLYSDKLTLVSRDKDQCRLQGCQWVIVVSADVRSLSECWKCVQALLQPMASWTFWSCVRA